MDPCDPKAVSVSFRLQRLLNSSGLGAGRRAPFFVHDRSLLRRRPQGRKGGSRKDAKKRKESGASGDYHSPARSIAPLGHYVLADIYSRQGRENEAAREVARARALERAQ